MVIRVHNLTHTYSPGTPFQTDALVDISLNVNGGEFFAVVGSTGSGKSTLVQHFNGILAPVKGEVQVLGLDVACKKVRQELWRRVGLVFQQPEQQLFEETVFDDVAFGPRNMGAGKDEVADRVCEALRLVGVDAVRLARVSPFSLSTGIKRRIAIAGVLAMRPDILVLDEPTAGLDPQGRRQLMDNIELYQRERGATVILVTHNMEEVARRAGRMAVLHQGRLVMEGTPRQVFARPGELRACGLDVPVAAELMGRLKQSGRKVRSDVLTNEEAVDEIALLLRSNQPGHITGRDGAG